MECSPRHISLIDSVVQEILDCGHWLHYGRRMQDEDKKSSKSLNVELLVTIITVCIIPIGIEIIGKVEGLKIGWQCWSLIILGVAAIATICYLYRRKGKYQLNAEDKASLALLLPQIEQYHILLITFLQRIDRRSPLTDQKVSSRFNEFERMKLERAVLRHNTSITFGKLNPEWEKESAKLASEELRPYMDFYEERTGHE